jgi:hypothetical protein
MAETEKKTFLLLWYIHQKEKSEQHSKTRVA